jgi:hypothetical protein
MADSGSGNHPFFEFHQNLFALYGVSAAAYAQRATGFWERLGSGTYGLGNWLQDVQRELTAQADLCLALHKVPFTGLAAPVWVTLTWQKGQANPPGTDVTFNRPVSGTPEITPFAPVGGGVGISLNWVPIKPGNRMHVDVQGARPNPGTYMAVVTTREAKQVPEAIVILHVL